MQGIGQCQPVGQQQFTHPQPGYVGNGSNQGSGNNICNNQESGNNVCNNQGSWNNVSYNIVGHYTLNNHLASSQCYYANPAQNASNQYNSNAVSLNQQLMRTNNASASQNPQLGAVNSNLLFYQSQAQLHKPSNQRLKSSMANVSLSLTNPTTSSTTGQMGHTQQPVSSPATQQMTFAPHTSYTQNPNVPFSTLPNVQNAHIYTITPVTILPTYINQVVGSNESVHNSHTVSQPNDRHVGQSADGNNSHCNKMATNDASNQSNILTAVPVQTQCLAYQQTSVRSNVNLQTVPPDTITNNNLTTSSVSLPSQTSLQKNATTNAAFLQTTVPSNTNTVKQCDNLPLFNMKVTSHNSSLCAPQHKALDSNRCEAFAKIDTVSAAQTKDCSLQVSPGRAARAVAVVLPLSQENSPIKHSASTSLSSTNPAPDSCDFSSKQKQNPPTLPDPLSLKQILQRSTHSSNISTDKENPEAPSTLHAMKLSLQDTAPKLSMLPLTFAQLVKGNCAKKLRRKSKSENKSTTPEKTGQKQCATEKPCEEKLSSVPTTEWTLGQLKNKIVELDHELKNSESKHDGDNSAKQIVDLFWNGDCKAMLKDAKYGSVSQDIATIRKYCRIVGIDTVILKQNQSKHPSRYHVLLHDEVYEAGTLFTSSWRNIHPLDNIDKEFGLPYFFKCGKDDSQCQDTEPKCQQKDKSQMEATPSILEPEKLENNNNASKPVPNPISSVPSVNSLRNNTEKNNELVHLDQDTENGAGENECISIESNDPSYLFKIEVLPPEEAKVVFEQREHDTPVSDTTVTEEVPPNDQDGNGNQTCHVRTLEKMCCIEKWKETVFGSSSASKCKCEEPNQDEQKPEQLENTDYLPMRTGDLRKNTVFTFPQESENIHGSKSSNPSHIVISSESEDESQVCETQTNLNEYGQTLVTITKSQNDVDSHKNMIENSNGYESVTTLGETFEHVPDFGKSSAETMENQITSERLLQPFKTPKLSTHLKSQTILESFSKSKNIRQVEMVELALFGSRHKKCDFSSNQQTRVQSSHTHRSSTFEKIEAPKRVYVKCSPFTKSHEEVEPQENLSVKKKLYENWRKSLPPATNKLKRKKRFSIVYANHGTTLHLSSIKHKEKKKRKSPDSHDDQGGEKKRTCSDGEAVNSLKSAVNEALPPQGNVLQFNVLPSTFNFEEGSNHTDSQTTSATGEKTVPASSPAEGNPPIQTKGAWCDPSTSKSSSESPTAAPDSTGIFQEYQRLFKMRQASADE